MRIGISGSGKNDFVSQTLSHVLSAFESLLSCEGSQQVDSHVDSSERGHIDCLSLDISSFSDSGRVFSGGRVVHGGDEDVDGVLSSLQVDDLESLVDDVDGLEFLSGISSVEEQASDESLDDGHGGLLEVLDLVSSGSVGDVNLTLGVLDCDVVLEGLWDVLDFVVVPLSEELGLLL